MKTSVKWFALFFCVLLFTLLCYAGRNYGRTYFYDDVYLQKLGAVTNVSLAVTSGGQFISPVTNRYWYQVSGTNLNGRIPLSAITNVVFVGSTNSSAVNIMWDMYSGVASFVILRSSNAGTSWVWRTLSPTATNTVDTGGLVWTNTVFTNLYSEIPYPEFYGVPSYQDVTNIVEDATEIGYFTNNHANAVFSSTLTVSNTSNVASLFLRGSPLTGGKSAQLQSSPSGLTVYGAPVFIGTNFTVNGFFVMAPLFAGQAIVKLSLPTSTNTWTASDTGRLWNSNGVVCVFNP